MPRLSSGRSVLPAYAWLLLPGACALAQGTVYPAGDGTTTVVAGREVCGSTTLSQSVLDGTSYAVASASEFAAMAIALNGSVPNPMGHDTSSASAGPIGITVVNPFATPLLVTQVELDAGAASLFQGLTPVQPATGWTETGTRVTWTGSISVPRHSSLDFIVQVRPDGGTDYTSVPVTLRAVTAAGTVSNTGHVVSQRRDNNTPFVSLPFVEGGTQVFSGSVANGGMVETGATKTFTVRVKESEQGNSQPIPVGSVLTVDVPPGWSGLTALASTGFGTAAVVEPTGCAPGTITVATTASILGSSADFRFIAMAPGNQGSVGLYTLRARIENLSVDPPIATLTELTQSVVVPTTTGTQDGLTAAAAYVAVPNPMGHNRSSTWGVALANPTALPSTVTQVRISAVTDLFRGVTGINPATGWSRPDRRTILWSGLRQIDAHAAADFMVSVQADNAGADANDTPITATVLDSSGTSYVSTSGTTTIGGGNPSANVYYLVAGVPSLYVFGVGSGQPRQFQLAVEESQGGSLSAGTELRIVVPRGWSSVAATAQTGFTVPTVVQPTGGSDGEVRTALTTALKSSRRIFTFSATSPPGLVDSLFLFPTTLTGSQAGSVCQALVQVVDNSGGLELVYLSPPITDMSINQIDVLVTATSAGPETYQVEIRNVSTGGWELLTSGTFDLAPSGLAGSVTSGFSDYLDPLGRIEVRVTSNSYGNHSLAVDQALFIISNYRLLPSSVAPPTASQGRLLVPIEALRLEVDIGAVDLETVTVRAVGSSPAADIDLVHLVADDDCDGIIDPAEADVAPAAPLGAMDRVVFGTPGTPLLGFAAGAPRCAIVAFDIALAATVDNLLGAEISSGFDLTSNVGPYPFPCTSGYPVRSGDVLITMLDRDNDGLTDAQEGVLLSDAADADTDDDGLLDGQELGGDAIFNSGIDTSPLVMDSDGDVLPDGLEEGEPAFTDLTDTDGDGTPDVVDPAPLDPSIEGTDAALFRPDLDPATTTSPVDDDSDDDGLLDGNEDLDGNGRLDVVIGGSGEPGAGDTDPAAFDTDLDGIGDGVEQGLAAPQGTGTGPAFAADADPLTTTSAVDRDSDDDGIGDGVEDADRDGARAATETDPIDRDSDEDGLPDGTEAGANGIPDPGETSALLADSDGDLVPDGTETGITSGVLDPDGGGPVRGTDLALFQPDLDPLTTTSPLDDDSDDDGLIDGVEDGDRNGRADNAIGGTGTPGAGETDATLLDSDGDGCQDGTEMGLTAPQGTGTDPGVFRPDAVPTVTSDPLDRDSDDDGVDDGVEDADCDGGIDDGESDPSGDPSVLRNDDIADLAGWAAAKPAIFTGIGSTSLVLAGPDGSPDPGEGVDPGQNGSDDDDDMYARRATAPWVDPDPVVTDAARPLVFYQVTPSGNGLTLVKDAGTVRLGW